MLRSLFLAAAAPAALVLAGCSTPSSPDSELVRAQAAPGGAPTITPQTSGTINRLQAISAVSPRIAWASGV
ncbi:MAG TPA: hypothetical protein VFT84_06130, partial [Gemmatimonadales bacterium]|nr:hypothetical protein [Gemmatimonadales bacterium]